MINKYIIFIIVFVFSLVSQGAPSCVAFLTNTENISHLMKNAKTSFSLRDYQESKSFLNKILDYDSEDYRALSLLSKIYYNEGDLELARTTLLKSIEFEPKFSEPSYYSMIQILQALDRKDDVITYAQFILEKNPTSASVLGILAGVYMFQNKFELANEILERKKALDPNEPHYLRLRAEYFLRREEPKLALSFANQLVNNHTPRKNQVRVPNSYRIGLILRSKIFILLERYDEAMRDIQKAEGFFTITSNWIVLIKAEINFKMGQIIASRGILINLINKSPELDLDVMAALVSIENEGQNTKKNPMLEQIFSSLSHQQALKVLELSRENNWIYRPPSEAGPRDYKITNSFWRGLHSIAINRQAQKDAVDPESFEAQNSSNYYLWNQTPKSE